MNYNSIQFDMNFVGNLASIFGFLITIFTSWMMYSLRQKIILRISIDDAIKKFNDLIPEITDLLGDYAKNSKRIDELFTVSDTYLRLFEKDAKGDYLSDIKEARKLLKKYYETPIESKNEDDARTIKTKLTIIQNSLEFYRKNLIVR